VKICGWLYLLRGILSGCAGWKSPIHRRNSDGSGGGTGQWGASIYYWTAHRIASHVTLCVLALPLEWVAEIRAGDTRRNIRLVLGELTAIRERAGGTVIVQACALQPGRRRPAEEARYSGPSIPSSPSINSRQFPHGRRYTRQNGRA